MSNESAPRVPNRKPDHPVDMQENLIGVLPDQKDVWNDKSFSSLDDAIDCVLAAHEKDGPRTDVKIEDVNKWIASAYCGSSCFYRPGEDFLLLRGTAFAHLCERAKAPPRYLQSIPMIHALPALNWGIRKQTEGTALLRLVNGDEVRAILSHRYAMLDDAVALPQLRDCLKVIDLLPKVSTRVVATGLTTLMRLSLPEEDAKEVNGEIVDVSFDLTNGEVGNRAVALSPSIYLRSRNTSARRKGLRLRHLGSPDRMELEFQEAMPAILEEAELMRSQLVESVDKIIKNMAAEAESLRSLGLSIAEARDVVRTIARDSNVTLPSDTSEWEAPLKQLTGVNAYDVFTAITQLGEERPNERRLDLEESAGRYLGRVSR